MVYVEPKIENFVNYSEKLFYESKNNTPGLIYFVNYKTANNKSLPKDILQYSKARISNHIDGKIIYLHRKKKNK